MQYRRTNINTPAKRTKSTALCKKYNKGLLLNTERELFSTVKDRKGAIGYRKGLYDVTIYIWLLTQ